MTGKKTYMFLNIPVLGQTKEK